MVAVAALFPATFAVAGDGYDVTVTGKVTSRYILQDLGIVASENPGLVTDVAITKGPLTLDWWQRYDLSGGAYGNRGYGDEHDITLTGDWQVGGFSLEASAAYYVLAPLDKGDTDGFQLYADVGRTFDLGGGISVAPAIRAIEFIAVKTFPTFTLLRGRLPISAPVPLLKNVTAILDPGVTGNLTPQVGQHDIVWRPTGSIVWKVSEALNVQFDAKATDRTNPEFDLGISYRF